MSEDSFNSENGQIGESVTAHGGGHTHENGHTLRPSGSLTKNERLVWDTLMETHDPLKAYEILDKLKEKGVRAPMTVYRALDGLESKGVIHKLDGINAFVLCNHEAPHSVQTFLVCNTCSHVKEVELDAKIREDVLPVVEANNFHMETARLEIKGQCHLCAHMQNG